MCGSLWACRAFFNSNKERLTQGATAPECQKVLRLHRAVWPSGARIQHTYNINVEEPYNSDDPTSLNLPVGLDLQGHVKRLQEGITTNAQWCCNVVALGKGVIEEGSQNRMVRVV